MSILRYIIERMRPSKLLPLSGLMLLGSLTATSEPLPERLFARIILALCLVVAWRLRDDLYSLPEDRLQWPDRVLSKVSNLTPFYALVGALWVGAMAITFALHGPWCTLLLWGTTLLLEGVYAWRVWSRRGVGLMLATIIVKYAGIVVVLAGGANALLWPELWSAVAIACSTVITYDLLEARHADQWRWRNTALNLSCALPGLLYLHWASGEHWWLPVPFGLWLTWVWSVYSRPQRWMQRRLAWLIFVVNGIILTSIWWLRLNV